MMRSVNNFYKVRLLSSALGVLALASLCGGPVHAQDTRGRANAVISQNEISVNRAVGVSGSLRRVAWSTGSEKDLYNLRLLEVASRLARTPGVMRNTKIWTARADVCGLAGDEILIQIRSPLTCGSLGCEIMVLSEAGGRPEVLLRTIGDTIDAPAMNELTINQGSNRQRSWKYGQDRFQQTRKR